MEDLNPGTYCFDCYPMPWTLIDLHVDEDCDLEVFLDLSVNEIGSLVEMLRWAWDNEWFEHSTSETVGSKLMEKHCPQLYERIKFLAHQKFCEKFPGSESVSGFGVYEIFIPDEIVCYVRDGFSKFLSRSNASR